jgi:cell division protein FtsQ
VRQGSHIGLVDGEGILLDMAPSGTESQTEPHYSFPVVTGLSAGDPASTRSARMKIYERFTADLDSSGEKVSEVLSEVDLSNPEDVKALIPANSSEILVHFGDDHFLERYRRFQEHLPAWHTQYPNLSSVDMRYEREVVLDMDGSTAGKNNPAPAPNGANPPTKAAAPAPHASTAHAAAKLPVKQKHHLAAKPPAHKAAPLKSATHASATTQPSAVHPTANDPSPATASAGAAARSGYLIKPAAGRSSSSDQYHPPQVPSR